MAPLISVRTYMPRSHGTYLPMNHGFLSCIRDNGREDHPFHAVPSVALQLGWPKRMTGGNLDMRRNVIAQSTCIRPCLLSVSQPHLLPHGRNPLDQGLDDLRSHQRAIDEGSLARHQIDSSGSSDSAVHLYPYLFPLLPWEVGKTPCGDNVIRSRIE